MIYKNEAQEERNLAVVAIAKALWPWHYGSMEDVHVRCCKACGRSEYIGSEINVGWLCGETIDCDECRPTKGAQT